MTRPGVADHVVQGFLGDAIQSHLQFGRQATVPVHGFDLHIDVVRGAYGRAVLAQRRNQSQVIETGRTQVYREAMQVLHDVFHDLLEPGRPRNNLVRILHPALQHPELDPQRCQSLPHFVVQLAGDRSALLFLDANQAAGERLELLSSGAHLVIEPRILKGQLGMGSKNLQPIDARL